MLVEQIPTSQAASRFPSSGHFELTIEQVSKFRFRVKNRVTSKQKSSKYSSRTERLEMGTMLSRPSRGLRSLLEIGYTHVVEATLDVPHGRHSRLRVVVVSRVDGRVLVCLVIVLVNQLVESSAVRILGSRSSGLRRPGWGRGRPAGYLVTLTSCPVDDPSVFLHLVFLQHETVDIRMSRVERFDFASGTTRSSSSYSINTNSLLISTCNSNN